MNGRDNITLSNQTYFYFIVVVIAVGYRILSPTAFDKTPCPFRVGKSDFISVYVCHNYVFFYGYLPLCNKLLIL